MLDKVMMIKAKLEFIRKLDSIKSEREKFLYYIDENVNKLYFHLYKNINSDLLEHVKLDFSDKTFVKLKRIPLEDSIHDTYVFYSLLSDLLIESNYYKYVYSEWVIINELKVYFQRKIFPKLLICSKMDFMITEKCSLKCKDCLNLMQYYTNPRNFDKDKLKKYIDLLTEQFDEITEIRILGGEPFMNRDIYKIIEYCQQKSNIKLVTIFTNATIIPKMEKINNKKILFYISNYGVKSQKPTELIKQIKKRKVDFIYNDFSKGKWVKNLGFEYNDLKEDELINLFAYCPARKCVTYVEGKIYHCEFIANAERIHAIPYNCGNSISIDNENIGKEEIIKYLFENSYLDGCKWCSRVKNFSVQTEPGLQIGEPIKYTIMES